MPGKRKAGKQGKANTIRDRRLAIRNSISMHNSCPQCGSSSLQVNGTFSNGNNVWTYCTNCNLNQNATVTHTHTHLTEWFDVYSTIVDAFAEEEEEEEEEEDEDEEE